MRPPSEEPGYTVREAVLIKTQTGSAWTVRFAGAHEEEDEVIVVIGPDKLSEMAFARRYTIAEIRALTAGNMKVVEGAAGDG
jgi:hypothetical protein